MSKLDEMIKELCPEGVEMVKLGDILDYKQPGPYIVKSTSYDDSYSTPVLTAGQSFILGFTNEDSGIYSASKDNPCIIFDDFTTSFHWVDFDFKIKSSAMKMLFLKSNKALLRYAYYAMTCIGYISVEHSRHWISIYSQFEIPLPPLSIQQKIVSVLDSFTTLIDKMKQEMEKRKKQMEYYREKLLTFKDGECEWKKLGELGHSFNGLTGKSKKDFEKGNSVFVTYSNIFNNPALNMDIPDRVMINEGEKQNVIQKGDILFTGSSETPEEAGMSSVVLKEPNENMYLNSFCFGLRLYNYDFVKPDYMKYLLRSKRIRDSISMTAFGVTRFNINKDKFFKVSIPIPSQKRQSEIVSTLDKFESYITKLEKMIVLRQKQYEYYREQLLTFE